MKQGLPLLFVVAIAAPFSASAIDQAPTAASSISDPVLRVTPSQKQMYELISDRAMRLGVSGSAVISCTIGDAGELKHCQADAENPAGYDFSRSLLRISSHIRVDPLSASGEPTSGRTVRLGMRLKITFSKPNATANASIELLTAPADIAALGPATTTLLTDPVWKARPADDDLWKYYPLRAYHYGINGVAVVNCLVGPTGWLMDCAAYGEDPKREGFGTALAKLASQMQVDAASTSGAPTVGRAIRIGAQFNHVPLPRKYLGDTFAVVASHATSIELVVVQQ